MNTREQHEDLFDALVGKAIVVRLHKCNLIDDQTKKWSCANIDEDLNEHFETLAENNPIDDVDAYFEDLMKEAEEYCENQWQKGL